MSWLASYFAPVLFFTTIRRRFSPVGLVFVLVLLSPLVAIAQEAGAVAPTPWVPILISVAFGCFGIVYGVVKTMAAREAIDGWDTAKTWMDNFAPMVEGWADPDSDSVPPDTQNRTGNDPNVSN